MDIQHQTKSTKGSFFIESEGQISAEMTYSRAGDKLLIIDHTEISASLRGKGVGEALVFRAVEFARANQLKILPLCPFAKSVFEKNPEIRDVLSK
ncbi:GNAT family N-acetyltransferase [Cyclobacterium plantarum]|uniref:N-acetyltransferase n=1 Tax=Cyclobacterium plantarum TaxID=2716263 RepID=A0ABX0H8N5_9BACT|nr:GNAT family N-acetyltransferase [Cyclobacterium plantarum]NHE56777.1 N-acetyltransferase [Cyclobacterium plantarum]